MNSPEGKTDFFKEVSRRLLEFEDELERNNYIEAVQQHTESAGKSGEDGRKDGCECRNGETGRKAETGRGI